VREERERKKMKYFAMMDPKNGIQNYEDAITYLPDKLFYPLVAKRFNMLLKQAELEEKNLQNEEREYLTIECLRETLYHLLSAKKIVINHEGKKVTIHKYVNQALRLWKWIPISKPTPKFIINISDLTPRILLELKTLDDRTYDYVVKLAVGQIFEIINPKYYRQSISKRLEVLFEQ
jgi:hypothetical protein